MFKIGQTVRLNRGHTPMLVLDIQNRVVFAKYSNSHSFPVTQWDYENPRASASYVRHETGFTAWDGAPISKEHYTMPTRYRTLTGPYMSGTYLNTTTQGDMVLEMDNGTVHAFKPHLLEEDLPNTFRVKSMVNNYSCHYEYPDQGTVQLGDILLSNSNNIYVVTEMDTKNRNPKAVFKGRRLVTELL